VIAVPAAVALQEVQTPAAAVATYPKAPLHVKQTAVAPVAGAVQVRHPITPT